MDDLGPQLQLGPLLLDTDGARRLAAAFFASKGTQTRRAYHATVRDLAAYLSARLGRPLDETEALGEVLRAGAGGANLLILEYRDALRARPLSPGSVNRALSCLRSAVALGRTFGLVAWSLEVPNVRGAGAYRDTRGPGKEAVRSMMDALGVKSGAKAIRDRALLRLLFDLALRRAEASSMDLEHLDLVGARAEVLRKGHTERTWLSLPPRTVHALEAWLAVRGMEAGPLFTGFRGGRGKRLAGGGVYRAVRKMGRDVGVETHPHAIRHSSVTTAVKAARAADIGLDEVRQFSGHASVETLMIYNDRERDVQGALAGLVAGEVDE